MMASEIQHSAVSDPERLHALRRLNLLGTGSEAAFDRLARLAASALGVPTALVNFVDDELTFFKSAVGLPPALAGATEAPNEVSFCRFVVEDGATVSIPDSRADPRVAHNPLVALGVAAYTGVPLMTSEGHTLGTLCVFDAVPHAWSDRERALLEGLAESVMSEIELRAARKAALGHREELERTVAQRTELLQNATSELLVSAASLRASREETIRRLARAVQMRSEEMGAHIDRMGLVCALLAERLDLSPQLQELIGIASPLHDIGKIAIPDQIITKPGSLTKAERRVMETHAERGYRMLAGSGEPMLELAATLAWTHHERMDGNGYPRRLRGDEIPIEGRIAAVADVFDALTNDRVYRAGVSFDEAIAVMRTARCTHFDADVLDALTGSLETVATLAGQAGTGARAA